ncbi:unnamed protein product [Brachionus calyciflorus]|uniref:ER membrane protein complex subunit 3 n=1 Tax=Brachionus calyciflorus TaxID=104777 RepID=A0A814BI04_9BILA|nr:unnamed protein product [Brachionus calyciflorus]
MAELLLDSKIRFWVFLPLMAITFLVGIIKHYLFIFMSNDKIVEKQQLTDSQALLRSRLVRENGKYIPKESFMMRKNYFTNEETGFFVKQKRQNTVKNPMSDPGAMTEMLKGNFLNMIPMVVIGGWINWAYAGFLCTKVPFPLTFRFKPMLQKDVNLVSLDASWVSSASWYIINLFGLRSMYNLVLGENNAADQTKAMQDQMSGAALSMPDDISKAFKAENESLTITHHNWALKGVEQTFN